MPKVWNKHRAGVPEDAVNIQRGTPWGNRFRVEVYGRGKCVALHREEVLADPVFQAKVRRELRGKDLLCGCAPNACHGDVLLEIANS